MTGSLYFKTDDVDALWLRLKDRCKVEYPLEDFDYGMREFAIRDNSDYLAPIWTGDWLTCRFDRAGAASAQSSVNNPCPRFPKGRYGDSPLIVISMRLFTLTCPIASESSSMADGSQSPTPDTGC